MNFISALDSRCEVYFFRYLPVVSLSWLPTGVLAKEVVRIVVAFSASRTIAKNHEMKGVGKFCQLQTPVWET